MVVLVRLRVEIVWGGRSYVMGGGRERVGIDLVKNYYELRIIKDLDLKFLNFKFIYCLL